MALAKTAWLRLDDWGLAPRSEANRRDLLEIVEDRHGHRATLLTSPLPVEHWQEALGDPTLADAILERLVPNASKLTLQGESMRQRQAKLPHGAGSDEQQPPSVAALHSWQASRGLSGNLPMDEMADIRGIRRWGGNRSITREAHGGFRGFTHRVQN